MYLISNVEVLCIPNKLLTSDYEVNIMSTATAPKSKCKNVIKSGLTDKEKKRALDLHNELRQKVAKGLETRGNPGPQPPAKSMPNLKWDDELAQLAQDFADQCIFGNDKKKKGRFSFGQNIGMFGTTKENTDHLKVDDIIMGWYNEVEHHPATNASKLSAASTQKSGHYTQMVWGQSEYFGCGGVKYKDGKFTRFLLVCNYGPVGNQVNKPVYQVFDVKDETDNEDGKSGKDGKNNEDEENEEDMENGKKCVKVKKKKC